MTDTHTDTNTHLDRLRRLTAPGTPPPDEDGDDEYTAFAAGRVGGKPQLTVAFRRVNGTVHAFAYAHLYAVEYDPSAGIALTFTRHRVTLAGRHLGDLFRLFCAHRVQAVQETDPLHADSLPDDAPVVTALHVAPAPDG